MADGQDDPHQDDRTGRPEAGGEPVTEGGESRLAGAPSVSGATALGVRRYRGRRTMRVTALAVSVLVLLTAATGAFLYIRLDGNIRDLPLFGGVGGDAGTERPDAFGRTPVNVLVIGSDTRADPEDCRLGGDCGPGQNADAGMVLHISADRSHASVLSIPRDTVTDLPACRDPHGGVTKPRHGQINSTLRYGPGCTVAAVHALTRIPIDHFVMADFAGVVRMSDAVGGVPVCVDRDVYDSYSHLKLAKGRHELQGTAALQFLRSRHAFGDGSDLGRTDAQHLFLGALAHRLRENSTFTDPASLLDLADAATQALTVDTRLGSVSRLVGLIDDLRKVPSARIAFVTMPNMPDPGNSDRVVVSHSGRRLFAAIAADLPLTVTDSRALDGKPDDPTDATGSTAGVTGSAGSTAGVTGGDDGDPSGDATRDPYGGGEAATATPRPTPTPTPPLTSPLTHTFGRTAGGRTACAQVATGPAVTVRGETLTPSAAFRATPWIPVSAP
ncbi:LCP family protein [Streptomyces sp. CBMA29]|uniref:LCP family protein n=1 Tax=Streptomyces sp. CBMA29 TaxID=1896314 RepID=UPI0016619F21|nr:LCP family protein [Streptomyces sp. CBMA29]